MNRVIWCGFLCRRLRSVSQGKCQVENLAAAATGDSGKSLLVRAELLLLVCLTAYDHSGDQESWSRPLHLMDSET